MKYIVVIHYSMSITPIVRIFDDKEKAVEYAESYTKEHDLKYSIHLSDLETGYAMEFKDNF